MGIEKRQHLRVQPHPRLPVHVQIIGKDFIDKFKVLDISVGGVGVHVPHRFEGCEINGQVDLVLSLPGVRAIHTRGTIRHVSQEANGSLFGLEFSNLSAEHRSALQKFIDQRKSGEDLLAAARAKSG